MLKEQIKGLSILSAILALGGLVLMFSSISIGTSLGDSWLMSQADGIADTNQYNLIVKTYINNFVIIGSTLFGAGILAAIGTYFTSVLLD